MRALLVVAAMIAAPASAEIIGADAHAFHIRQSVQLVVPPAQAMAAFTSVAK